VSRTRYIAQAGVIAAVYGSLTWLTLAFGGVLAWGPIQFRVSEAATVLAMFTPAAIPGLAIGSVVANLFNPQALWPFATLDVVLGTSWPCCDECTYRSCVFADNPKSGVGGVRPTDDARARRIIDGCVAAAVWHMRAHYWDRSSSRGVRARPAFVARLAANGDRGIARQVTARGYKGARWR
jgi:hypothetical protein